MQCTEEHAKYLHAKLPINDNEKIVGVYKHHWFAYASTWFVSAIIILLAVGLTIAFMALQGNAGILAQHKAPLFSGLTAFCILVVVFSFIPVYLKSQEEIVLTEEAILQILQPSLFASKVSQLNLTHVADVTVRQDFFGSIFGFGHITVETPGEQDNYEFNVLAHSQKAAKEIIEAHENYQAAVESGRMTSTFSGLQPQAPPQPGPQIDPQQYQQFLEYQKYAAAQQAANTDQSQQTVQPQPQNPAVTTAYAQPSQSLQPADSVQLTEPNQTQNQ